MDEKISVKGLNRILRYKISICMIVRDEEKFLDNCLRSLKPLIDCNLAELIIVDTGSIDNTVEIAKKYTEHIYFKQWNNNFSEARNYSISLANGEYIFIMDADQEMEYSEVKKLIKLFKSNDYKNYNTYSLVYKNFTNEELSEYTYFSLNLIFKNDGYFKYEGRIHNQPLYKEPVKNLEIYMLHYGYIMTEDIKEKKFKRTATLLKSEIEKYPKNIYYIYQLSRSYEMHGDTKEAVVELEKYLSLMKVEKVNDNFKINYYHNATIIYFNAKMYDKCIYYCEKIKEIDNELIDCYYLIGKCNVIEGDMDEAIRNLDLYLKHLKKFKYEKYASTNGLEIFSYGHKYRVIGELFRFKIKINQLECIDKYICELIKEDDAFMLMLDEILKIYVVLQDFSSLDKIINKVKAKNEGTLLLYLLSKAINSINVIDREKIIKNINSLSIKEKKMLSMKVEKEEKNEFDNLIDFIDESIEGSKKVINIENCVIPLITTLNNSCIDEIVNCNYKDEIIYIIKYLLGKCDMLINGYLVSQDKILELLNRFGLIIKNINEDKFKEDLDFVIKLDEFRNHIDNKEIIKGISKLKESIEIKSEFSNLVSFIKDSIFLTEYNESNNLVSNEDMIKIKGNLMTLINSNMINQAMEVFTQLEELYNINEDVELVSIKGTLKFYNNEIFEAEKVIKEGLKHYPKNIDLLYNLAYIYETNKKYFTAINTYITILEIDTDKIYFKEINGNIERLRNLILII